jgi:intracellular septation protein A
MIKSLNLEAINYRVIAVSSLFGKRSVFVNGSLTASTKSSTQIPWKFASLRHLSEETGRIVISNVLGTGEPVSRAGIPTLAQNSRRPWKVQGLRPRPRK